MRRLLLALAAALVVAAPAEAKTETVTSGPIAAQLSFDEGGAGSGFQNVRIAVDRGGQRMVDEPIQKDCSFCLVTPAGGGAEDSKSVFILDLEADAEPEVIVNLFTGGANCCFYSLVWRFDGVRYQRHRLFPMGSFSFEAQNIDKSGPLELITQDYRFAYQYGSNVDTPRPVRILRFRAGRLVDVTRSFRAYPKNEAARLYRFYLRLRKEKNANVRGVFAAYVANEYNANRGRIAWRRLLGAYRRGDFRRKFDGDSGKFGRAYVTSLRRFLRRTGYIRSR